MTNKKMVRKKYALAFLDFYPNLARDQQPCWYIRASQHGAPISDVCPTPKAAWENATQRLAVAVQNKRGPYSEVPKQLQLPIA
jgi:hypothetical protein